MPTPQQDPQIKTTKVVWSRKDNILMGGGVAWTFFPRSSSAHSMPVAAPSQLTPSQKIDLQSHEPGIDAFPMESQTRVSKWAPREFRNWRVQGNPLTLRQAFANPSPTFRQPFANLFCQPLSNSLFPWTPGTRLETLVNGFLDFGPEMRKKMGETWIESQGQILAVWILVAKLPNSDLNFAVDFLVDFFLLFSKEKGPKKIH